MKMIYVLYALFLVLACLGFPLGLIAGRLIENDRIFKGMSVGSSVTSDGTMYDGYVVNIQVLEKIKD